MQNQIKALILYYYNVEEIREKVILSNGNQSNLIYDCGRCYLIDESWMNVYKMFFNYQELIKQIKNNMNINSFDIAKKNLEIISATLGTSFVEPLKLKEKDNPDERCVNLVMETGNFIESDKHKIIIRNPTKYNIINEEIFEYMNKKSKKDIHILKDLKHNKLEYIIYYLP